MKLEQVLERIKDPTTLIDPREIDEIMFWVSSWQTDKEEALAELDQQVAIKLDELATRWGSDAAGKRKLALEPIYQEQKKTERLIKTLKGFKSNLRRRYEILTNQFR